MTLTSLSAILFTTLVQNPAILPAERLNEGWWAGRHARCQADTQRGGFDVAFLGDSITQGWEGGGQAVWERDFAPLNSANFGFSGDRTEHVLWRLQNGELVAAKPKLVVMMIGTNNVGHRSSNPEQTAVGVRAILDLLAKETPKTKVLLLGVFPRSASPTEEMRVSVNAINARIQKFGDGKRVQFLDISRHFLRENNNLRTEIMPDQLHLNELGYDVWGRAIREKIVTMLGTGERLPKAGRWRNLFDGKSLAGWTQLNGTATYRAENGTIIGKTQLGSPNSFLCSERKFADFELEFETLVDDRLNSGVQIRSLTQGTDPRGRVWGPQVEVESAPGQAGFVYGEATPFGWLSTEPELKDARINQTQVFRNREWNHYRVIAHGPRIRTWLNGVPIADLTHAEVYKTHPSGFIGLQVHSIGANEGPYEVAWRNIRIREIR
ncbi:MAG: family 16 glycoside hydrolase [Fimbriimonas sp.]